MKNLFLLFIAVSLASCSSDDGSKPVANYEVLDHDYSIYENVELGHRFEFTATVKNNTDSDVSGAVKFTIPEGNSTAYEHIEDVTLTSGETKTVSGVGSSYFDAPTININKVEFVITE